MSRENVVEPSDNLIQAAMCQPKQDNSGMGLALTNDEAAEVEIVRDENALFGNGNPEHFPV
jgi:hypothetical protein